MYKKIDQNQLTLEEFNILGNRLSAENRWVKMAKIMPWVMIEELYAKSFSESEGRPPIPARSAYGAINIKEQENLTDERTAECLAENPYAQYFVGLKEFRTELLFDSSMMVHFQKRFSSEAIKQINEAIYDRTHPKEKEPPAGKNDPPASGGNGNRGTMILDATVAPADIKYPTDLSLLNACREDSERIIGKLCEHSDKSGHKTAYSRKKARKNYLKIAKQRKAKAKAMRKAVGEQLGYHAKNMQTLENLLMTVGYDRITDTDLWAHGSETDQERPGGRGCTFD